MAHSTRCIYYIHLRDLKLGKRKVRGTHTKFCLLRKNTSQSGMNETHQLLVYADGVNILGESIKTLKKNKEAL